MSLFRKPKKIQRRMFCADDDEDGEPEPPPPPLISQMQREKKENKLVKAPKLLSFADEEEDCEEFKVKKSSQSKRLSKRREKEKKKVPDGDNIKFDKDIVILEDDTNDGDTNQEREQPKPKKKITLEGLILSGREALAADGAGDMSESGGEEEEDDDEEDSRGFHQYRAESVRAALAVAPGHIPDAALIHAARKTRQQARELGDFIPVPSEAPPGARLVREGEGDDSADEEEGRIHVRGLDLPSDKPKRGTAAVQSDEEINSEAEEWEEQQMQKAMPALPDITGEGEVNPFSVAPPPPPRLAEAPAHLRPLAGTALQLTTAAQLVGALRNRLEELQADRSRAQRTRAELQARLQQAGRARGARAGRRRPLAAAYRRAQAARGYLTDLVECLDEKMPLLEALEARALALHRRRCEFLIERRRADVRDQAQDVLALAARPGSVRPPEPAAKVRRTAEREGRRRARRLRREAGGAAHHRDGDSSDDDLPPGEMQHYNTERESIRAAAASLFADALPAWRSARGVCARLAAWRRRDPRAYCDAHAPAALPKLLAPYVRHQLILWNPLADEDNEDYEKMDWYKCLMMYGVRDERVEGDSSDSEAEAEDEAPGAPPCSEDSVREDPDLMLLPTMLNKVVLPKITELVEQAWDPMCVRACVRLRQALVRAAAVPHAARALRRLAASARVRLDAALHADVFLPALPPQVMEGAGGPFWRRCAGAGVRLLRGALALSAPPELLRADPVVKQLIDTLSYAAGAAPGPFIASAAIALAETLPRSGAIRRAALRRLAALAALAVTRLDGAAPHHLKALEQARTVIAEAKAMEQ